MLYLLVSTCTHCTSPVTF